LFRHEKACLFKLLFYYASQEQKQDANRNKNTTLKSSSEVDQEPRLHKIIHKTIEQYRNKREHAQQSNLSHGNLIRKSVINEVDESALITQQILKSLVHL